jgi:hypothetical protein
MVTIDEFQLSTSGNPLEEQPEAIDGAPSRLIHREVRR